MKNTAILLSGAFIFALGGCANSYSQVRTALEEAPDWYKERRKEVRGEGYPELTEVPVIDAKNRPGQSLPAAEVRVAALASEFAAAEAVFLPPAAVADIEAASSRLQSEFAALSLQSDFLTDADAEAIRQQFNVPRVTEGLINPP